MQGTRRITMFTSCLKLQKVMCKQHAPCRTRRYFSLWQKVRTSAACSISPLVRTPECRVQHCHVRECSSDTTQILSALEYEQLADETLDSLTEVFEDLPERLTCDPEYDVTLGSGVLTVKISKTWGTYVINKQAPNKQIWLSSPKSGPKRYDYTDGVWIYKHDGQTMHDLLTIEISQAIGEDIDFTHCTYGKR